MSITWCTYIAPVYQAFLSIHYTSLIDPWYEQPIALNPIIPHALYCTSAFGPYYTPTRPAHAPTIAQPYLTPIALDGPISYPTHTPHIPPVWSWDAVHCIF